MDAVYGLLGVVIGWALLLISDTSKDRRAAKREADASSEARSAHLWELSRHAASELQADFVALAKATRRRYQVSEPDERFEDVFDESWEGQESQYEQQVALIPDATFRSALETVIEGIGANYGLVYKAGYASSREATVNQLAALGFDLTSAWLRGERVIDARVFERIDDLRKSLAHMYQTYQEEQDAERDNRAKR